MSHDEMLEKPSDDKSMRRKTIEVKGCRYDWWKEDPDEMKTKCS